MAALTATEPLSFETDNDGVVRIGGTRVTLDTIVSAFNEGATAEEIAYQYPTVRLADVYAVIAYYLQRRSEVDQYLQRRQQQANRVLRENETRFDPADVRDRLMARTKK